MAKITVTANSDFFDGVNQTTRRKGDVFVVQKDHAKTLDVKAYTEKKEHPVEKVKTEKKHLSNNPGAKTNKK